MAGLRLAACGTTMQTEDRGIDEAADPPRAVVPRKRLVVRLAEGIPYS
jgi:hypothetical protein